MNCCQAWKNWRDGTPLLVLDPALGGTYSVNEVAKCLKIGLLCAQEDPNHRPTMADIVRELTSHPVTLELPRQPAFCHGRTGRLESDKSPRGLSLGLNFGDHQWTMSKHDFLKVLFTMCQNIICATLFPSNSLEIEVMKVISIYDLCISGFFTRL